ncbi:class I SAM-dependent methyltransferase [Paludicola sp. MB14-C6]|uniref:class I SAM-dependent methyltransferase n=1 Tax=Paludihabitans sp. MB14-C6 TaxID=3070656 RepID=UPI0027DC7EBB|nr:class I SAM-dependent methyltransferase [Paludicola sp. MB14-C6]WMJ22399.1 class I SAM-dependent methyltransferase [Paludicola sp. MB14-C6]
MTDFQKIEHYYSVFDEKNRTVDSCGKLEFMISMDLLKKLLPTNAEILDLGGGAGVYTVPLAKSGYIMHLADLSESLLNQAKEAIEKEGLTNVKTIQKVNAIDLSLYDNNQFDVVILFGPLYHLLEEAERNQCISEVARVLKPNGLVFASFIPYYSGSIGIVDRLLFNPTQVDLHNLSKVFLEGKFQNNAMVGFQEGYYPHHEEIQELFNEHGFEEILLRSIRSFGYNREKEILQLKETNPQLFSALMDLINLTATDKYMLETCAHAMYVGKLK